MCRRLHCSQVLPRFLHTGTGPSGWAQRTLIHQGMEDTAGSSSHIIVDTMLLDRERWGGGHGCTSSLRLT